MAPLPIESEIRHRVKVTVRWACALFVVQRLVWVVSAMGLALLALVAIDWGLRGTQPGYRWLLSGLCWSVVLMGGIGWGLPVLRWRLTEMQAAWLIEKSQPQLRGYLASSLSLVLHTPAQEPEGLVRAALIETQEKIKDLQPRRLLKWDRLKTGMLTVGLVVGAIGTLAWLAPQFTSIGIARLVSPAEDIRWPAKYQLRFEAPPAVVARGVPMAVRIREQNGDLPRRVTLQIRNLQSGALQTLDAQAGGHEVTVLLPGSDSEFEMRALGGDGDTGWRLVQVADPPTIEDFELRAQPPECLGLSPLSATGPLRAPEGSSVLCYGRADQSLSSARLLLYAEGAEPQALPLSVTEDGYAFFLARNWVLSEDLEYEIEVVADSGLSRSAPRYPLSVQRNAPPILEWRISELELNGELYVVEGVAAQIELNAVDDFGLQWLAMEQAAEAGSLVWNRFWETDTFDDDRAGKKLSHFLIEWVPEKLSVESDIRLLRPKASDQCGLVSAGTERRVKVVTQDGYLIAVQKAWEDWSASLMPVRQEAIELKDLVAQMQIAFEEGATLDASKIRQASFRTTRLVDDTLSPEGAAHRRLMDLRDWVMRYKLDADPVGSRILEITQSWDKDVWPRLTEIDQLWKTLASLPGERRQNQLEVLVKLHREQQKLADFFLTRLGHAERVSLSQWFEKLKDVHAVQQRLISETEELRTLSLTSASAGETAAVDLSRSQVEAAVTLENLQQEARAYVSGEARSPQDAGFTQVLAALTSQPIAVWQRESARSLKQQKYAASLSFQRQASEALQEILKLDQVASLETQGRRKEVWMSWLETRLAESEGIQNELRILQHVEASEAIAKRSNELLAKIRQLRFQLSTAMSEATEWSTELQPVIESTLLELERGENTLGADDFQQSEGHMAAAASTLRNGIDELKDAWNTDPQVDSFERQLRSKLKSWALYQGSIVSDLRWLSALMGQYDDAEVRDILSQRQGLLQQSVMQRPEAWSELGLLNWELDEIGSEMESLSTRYREEPRIEDLVESAQRVWERLAVLAETQSEASPGNASSESPENEKNPDGESESVRRPAGWKIQLAVIRQRQAGILQRTVQLSEQNLEPEADRGQVDRLNEEQNRLLAQTRRLGEAAAALLVPEGRATDDLRQENSVELPGLPGLPGSGGLPGLSKPPQSQDSSPVNSSTAPENQGEDVGEERHPLATIETRMELVSEYFARYDCSKANQDIQQAIIDELSSSSPQNDPSDSNQSGESQASQSEAGNSVGGEAQGVDAAELLPEELMIRSGIWGHLPPELQKGVQTLWVDGWIEGYEDASIEYFQELGQRLEGERD